MENSWHALDTPWGKFLILALEFLPRDAVVDWANKVAQSNHDRQIIVVTHFYLTGDDKLGNMSIGGRGKPTNYGIKDDANDGIGLWEKFVSKHKNIRLVLSGHVLPDGTGYLKNTGDKGQKIHQILANYQCGTEPARGYGGGGYLRLMEFLPDGKTVRVRTYSPWYNHWLQTPDDSFDLEW